MAEEQQNGCTSSDCAGCAHAGSCSSKPQDLRQPANPFSKIKKVIAVVSGKGGVGKSMVTASLARMMREQGFSVGILDADVTGPSIPKMFGIHEKAQGDESGIFPCEAKDGTKIMSVNLLLENESDFGKADKRHKEGCHAVVEQYCAHKQDADNVRKSPCVCHIVPEPAPVPWNPVAVLLEHLYVMLEVEDHVGRADHIDRYHVCVHILCFFRFG